MSIEIKEIVVKTEISSPTDQNSGTAGATKEMLEKMKVEIMNEVSIAIFNQLRKNNDR